MAETSSRASPSGGKPSGHASQPTPGTELSNSHIPHARSFEPQRSEVATAMQNNTPSEQTIPPQPTAPSAPPAQNIPVQETTAFHSQPLETPTLSSSTTATAQTDEKRDITMPKASATTNNNANNNNNNLAASILAQGRAGGAPARVYLNEKVVPYLLEGMKSVAKEQPSDPLRALGEYLLQKSNESGEVSNRDDQMSG